MAKAIFKWFIGILIALLALAVSAAVAAGVCFWLVPYRNAENSMMLGARLILYEQEDGSVILTWPQGDNQDRYLVEIVRPLTRESIDLESATVPEEEVLYSTYVFDATSCTLPDFPRDELLTIRVSTAREYRWPEEDRLRMGETCAEATGVFAAPTISNLQISVAEENDLVLVLYEMAEESSCRVYTVDDDGQYRFYDTLATDKMWLQFGEGGMFPMPSYDKGMTLAFDCYSKFEDYDHYGIITETITIEREDLLGSVLNMVCTDEGNNVYTLTWKETKGEYYEVQQWNAKKEVWETLQTIPRDGERSYTTKHLEKYSDFKFRVYAAGGQTLEGSEYAALPEEVEVTTGASPVFCTIWPQQELEVYSDTTRETVIGTVPAAKAFCVLDAKEGLFLVRTDDGYGYIDSNYCMINLPEYLGDIISYNITNSYESLYMAHGYEIPEVTGQLIVGYDKVRLYTEEDYLVPLLYPAAQKIEDAAFLAIDRGYRLKIYDSYRPARASRELYKTAEDLVDQPIPEQTFSGEPMEEMPELEEGEVLTYYNLMTDYGRYALNYFLAKNVSRHNKGIAVDLTLEKYWSGEELEMQTAMHDLTWYSELKRNNDNADLLASIMKKAGFGGLVSEWWHFQDDDAQAALDLEYMQEGVSPECWMADDNGWRYRRANGRYYTNRTVTIGGVEYTFDANGYVVEPA